MYLDINNRLGLEVWDLGLCMKLRIEVDSWYLRIRYFFVSICFLTPVPQESENRIECFAHTCTNVKVG